MLIALPRYVDAKHKTFYFVSAWEVNFVYIGDLTKRDSLMVAA